MSKIKEGINLYNDSTVTIHCKQIRFNDTREKQDNFPLIFLIERF